MFENGYFIENWPVLSEKVKNSANFSESIAFMKNVDSDAGEVRGTYTLFAVLEASLSPQVHMAVSFIVVQSDRTHGVGRYACRGKSICGGTKPLHFHDDTR